MILEVSAERTEDVSFSSLRELEERACHELDEVVTIHEELLELDESVPPESLVTESAEGDDRVHEELDSSIALLSPPSGPELLESSPQAVKKSITAVCNKRLSICPPPSLYTLM